MFSEINKCGVSLVQDVLCIQSDITKDCDRTSLTHLPLVSHIYASVNLLSIDSGNGLSPFRCQAITRTNAGLLSIRLLGTHFSEVRIGILSFSFKKRHLKLSSVEMAPILSRGRWVKWEQYDENRSRFCYMHFLNHHSLTVDHHKRCPSLLL